MTASHRMDYMLLDQNTPVLPRPDFAFYRTPQKIFFIGFNKTATSALFILMTCAGVRSIHSSGNGKFFGRTQAEKDRIPHALRHVEANIKARKDPLDGLEDYDCFMDLTAGPRDICRDFDILHKAYPDAYFILNTRDKDAWITSRAQHRKSIRFAAQHFGLPRRKIRGLWAQHFDEHHAKARQYFAKHSPDRFLEWDITHDPALLTQFLAKAGVKANPQDYFRIRETNGTHYPEGFVVLQKTTHVPIFPSRDDNTDVTP